MYVILSESLVDLFEMGDKTRNIKFISFIIFLCSVGLTCLVFIAAKKIT
jgi:hypothetical protein